MTWYSSNALGKTWDRIKKSRGREGRRPPSVGLDGVTAEKFDAHLEQNIAEIHRLLSQPDLKIRVFLPIDLPFRIKTISSEPEKLRPNSYPPNTRSNRPACMSDEQRVLSKLYPDFLRLPRHAVKQVIMGRESGKLHVLRADVNKYYSSIPLLLFLNLADCEVDPG